MGYAYGYPVSSSLENGQRQWMTYGSISSVNSTKFDIGTYFIGGISGGPTFLQDGGHMIVGMCKGVFTGASGELSQCVRVTQNMINIVNSLN